MARSSLADDTESLDRKIDEVWKKVDEMNHQLMSDWMKCFGGSYNKAKLKSKQDIKSIVTDKEYRSNPSKNFLLRMTSRDPSLRRLAMNFLHAMTADSYWDDFISVVVDCGNSESSTNVSNFEQQNRSPREQMTETDGRSNHEELPPLHKAARFENVRKVRHLTTDGIGDEIVHVNPDGYTPLHFAAMAINPNPEIAELLINSANGEQWLNAKTDDRNTALHVAAANVNVTRDFIEALRNADSLLLNSQNDTPYHVAARSSNEEAIIYLLTTFSPTNNQWDVDDVEKGNVDQGQKVNEDKRKRPVEDKVINICARNGNAKAVALLIKRGADISNGVLHDVVLESVRDPEKIEKLMDVYQSIVDNAVTWYCLETKTEFLKLKGSDDYTELFRKIMIWLLTKQPRKEGGSENRSNVIECALEHGASAMFWRIMNTKSVFRTDGKETSKWLVEKTGNSSKNSKKDRCWTVFDVTNFMEETSFPKPRSDSDQKNADCESRSESTPLNSSTRAGVTEPNKAQHKAVSKCNRPIDDLSEPPRHDYLTHLLLAFDLWRSSNVLSSQPLKELTRPYRTMMQRLYFLLGLIQLIYMICFTTFHMPTTCSLARMLNVSNTPCNSSSSSNIVYKINTALSAFSHQYPLTLVLWLIWPTILMAATVFATLYTVKQLVHASENQSEKLVFKSKDLHPSVRRKVFEHLLPLLMPSTFCIAIFVWFCTNLMTVTHVYYVDVTGVAFLLGWAANLYFLGAVSQSFIIFISVLSKLMAKDIPSFMLFFGFTVLACSFAMHTLRTTACSPNDSIDKTFFSVLSSAFGIGDFFEVTMTDSTCAGATTLYLFEIIYFFYVCATMIILLNVLIAMINYRYEKSKPKVENLYTFHMLFLRRILERHKALGKITKKLLMPKRPDIGCDEKSGSLFFNNRLNRWYLRLMLPVDKQTKKP